MRGYKNMTGMKRYIYALAALPFFALASCDDTQEGATPGGDSAPSVVLYQYEADSTYDADCTTKIRLAINSATESLYLLTESQEDYASHFSGDEAAYADYVVSNGEKIETNGEKNIDQHLNIVGLKYITAVAVKGSSKCISKTVTFDGKNYKVVEGTEDYVYTNALGETLSPKLLVCEQDPNLYRLKGLKYSEFGQTEFNLDFSVLTNEETGEAEGGDGYRFVRVFPQVLPYEYGSYGVISVQDIAAMQNNVAYATSKYGCIITDDNQLQFQLNIYVSAGNLVEVGIETFGPAE